MDDKNEYDVIIIGAGAAGLFAAGICGGASLSILLLEGKEKPGRKLLITGGGRCNISHVHVDYQDFNSRHPRTVKNILSAFSAPKTAEFFRHLGVITQADPDGNLFPITQSAATVLEALVRRLPANVNLQTARKVNDIRPEKGLLRVVCGRNRYCSRTILLCPGGSSYPLTGSDGSGFTLAKTLGHTIIPPGPALTPLLTKDPDWKQLSGISLPCSLRIKNDSGRDVAFEGPLLFTHKGFSGPCVLNISRHWIQSRNKTLWVNFLPRENESSLREKMLQAAKTNPKKTVKTWLSDQLPARLVEVILQKAGMDHHPVLGQIPKNQRETIIRQISGAPLPVSSAMGYRKAEVTAGGVDLSEVNAKTLESNIIPGLFFAGEVLDVDGPIGGYNLQWAWSSAFVAGQSITKRLKRE